MGWFDVIFSSPSNLTEPVEKSIFMQPSVTPTEQVTGLSGRLVTNIIVCVCLIFVISPCASFFVRRSYKKQYELYKKQNLYSEKYNVLQKLVHIDARLAIFLLLCSNPLDTFFYAFYILWLLFVKIWDYVWQKDLDLNSE